MRTTIGRYIPGDTIIHKANPVIKLIINTLFIIFVFLSKSFIILLGLWGLSIIIFFLAKLRKKQLISIFITTLTIGFFIFCFNIFIIKSGYGSTQAPAGLSRVDYYSYSASGYFFETTSWWKLKITDRALFQTLFIILRIYIMIVITTITTTTTKPKALTSAIEFLLTPLKIFFIPVHIIAMIISIALRFVPTLLEEAQRIMKAQASRGVDFKNGNLKTKSKSMITLIIPLFVSAFAKAEDLGNAMETRGYDPYEKRTKYRVYPIGILDIIFMMLIVAIFVLIILIKVNVFTLPFWWI